MHECRARVTVPAMQPLTKSAASLTIVVMVLLMTAVRVRGREQANSSVSPKDTIVYVGTYTGGKTNSQGIYAFKMQGGSPALVPLDWLPKPRVPPTSRSIPIAGCSSR